MTGSPIDMLGLIGAAAGAVKSVSRVTGIGDATPFAELLGKAQAGVQPTGLPVSVREGAGVSLDQTQLDRLAVAADRAASQGASTAVIMLDGKAYELDVTAREITGTVDQTAESLTLIDSFLFAPAEAPGAHTGLDNWHADNADIRSLLAERDA
ncbi:MAG: hypothetical protein AAGB48_08190 [Planctomycetota bacterium]